MQWSEGNLIVNIKNVGKIRADYIVTVTFSTTQHDTNYPRDLQLKTAGIGAGTKIHPHGDSTIDNYDLSVLARNWLKGAI